MELRPPEIGDIDAVMELIEEHVTECNVNYPKPERAKVLQAIIDQRFNEDFRCLIAVENGKVVGMIAATAGEGCWCSMKQLQIGFLRVSPEKRGSLLSRKMIRSIESWGRGRGCGEAQYSHASGIDIDRGVRFMEAMGYTPVGVEMVKVL